MVVENLYDLVIIGGGASGLASALQAGKHRLRTVVFDKEMLGGWLLNAPSIDDYPGFPDGIPGVNLAMALVAQVEKLAVESRLTEVVGIERRRTGVIVSTADGHLGARTAIIATGGVAQKLEVSGAEELEGAGVSHCATCDGPLFKGQPVAVVGSGDEALREALHLAQYASRVVVIHGNTRLSACRWLQEKARATPKLEFRLGTQVEGVAGQMKVGGLRLKHIASGTTSFLDIAAVFVSLGARPNTGFLSGLLRLEPEGAIPTNAAMETEVPGIFAAGMAREGHAGELPLAVAEGIIATTSAKRFLDANQ